jgi:hypothetical protein
MKLSCLSDGVSDLTRNVREMTEFISKPSAKNLSTADRMALRALLKELRALVRTADGVSE